MYKSKKYSTSYAEELNNDSVNYAQHKKENITASEILGKTSDTISADVFSHADKTKD